jgi:hypothetical protein
MSDPLAERLKRFTPDATALQRDALLFRAGQASVRPARTWKALACALAVGQALTLALLGPRPAPPAGRTGREPPALARVESPPAPQAEGPEPLALGYLLQTGGDLPAEPASDALAPDAPGLRAFALPQPPSE